MVPETVLPTCIERPHGSKKTIYEIEAQRMAKAKVRGLKKGPSQATETKNNERKGLKRDAPMGSYRKPATGVSRKF
jgi:hypothetical protein